MPYATRAPGRCLGQVARVAFLAPRFASLAPRFAFLMRSQCDITSPSYLFLVSSPHLTAPHPRPHLTHSPTSPTSTPPRRTSPSQLTAQLLFTPPPPLHSSRQPDGFAATWSWRCATAGAVLFALSDSLLAYDRFVSRVPYAHLLVAALYFQAQLLIAMSARGSQPRPLSKGD